MNLDSTATPEKEKAAHTPGPWGIERTRGMNWIGPLRQSGDGKVSDVLFHNDRDGLRPEALMENDANANLIAAAPDLLATLKDLLLEITSAATSSYCEVCNRHAPKNAAGQSVGPVPHAADCFIWAAVETIAKAQGRS